MKCLADTHLLLWSIGDVGRLSATTRTALTDPDNVPMFSVVSVWEVAIKAAKRLSGFAIDPRVMRTDLLAHGWVEIEVTAEHALAAGALPPIHGDPFDRMLVAQATVEGAVLLTANRTVARYLGPVRLV
ncbi:MAG: type II toxin-antitoxin system VapC family toxin [Amaricoccus sp.]|uniref:type II toxin-antitoxin system VapC family toxin n=1 Tax=Amaricoccus sp. TaxID=1872485 RepID=UPI0039E7227A